MIKHMPRFFISLLLSCAALAQSSPSLNPNDWNFVLVPSFEHADKGNNNLSDTGLNHALRFGQLLNGLMSGKSAQLQQVYAFIPSAQGNDMAPLESIEPFALLNNQGVNTQTLTSGDPANYGTPGYFVRQILANQPRGTYVISLPTSMVSQVVAVLSSSSSVNLEGGHQYIVVSGSAIPFATNVYDDQLPDVAGYPGIPQSLPPRAQCAQAHVKISAPVPANLQAYKSQTVYLVRHVEAHPTSSFENGNYVCQGQWRALGANERLLQVMDNAKPDYIFTSAPENIIACGSSCSYIRPSLTVAPFAIQYGLPLTLAQFQWSDATDLAQTLFNRESPYEHRADKPATILVGWEHDHIEKAVKYLFATMYHDTNAANSIPSWGFDDYDTVWELKTDKAGNLTFSNSCEGIPTAALPSTCPAYFNK